MRSLVLAIDQSTQGTKALLFDEMGAVVGRTSRAHEQYVDERGWVEHDPEEIMTNVLACARTVCKAARVVAGEVRAVGISNQRETCLAWDRVRREPLARAIVWQCGRARGVCDRLAEKNPQVADRVRELSGLALSPYFSAAKLAWLLGEVPEVRAAADAGTLCLGTVDSWLVFKLCEGNPFVTEPSNACRTQLLDIRTGAWSDELCEVFGVAARGACRGAAVQLRLWPHHDGRPLCRSRAGLRRAGGLPGRARGAELPGPGDVKATYGTGSSVMMQTGAERYESKNGLVTSIAWDFSGERSYVLEGNLNYTGAVITWLRDQMRLIEGPGEVEPLIAQANPDDRAYFVPAFTGLGAPWWDSEATGLLTGVTRTTGRAEMVKACAECIPYQVADVVEALRADTGLAVGQLRADGGVTQNRYLMQFQADVAGAEVVVSDLQELSAAGAAFVAGRAAGVWELNAIYERLTRTTYAPQVTDAARSARMDGWHAAVRRAMSH